MNRIWRTPFARHHYKHPVTPLTGNQGTLRLVRQSENLEQTIQWRDVAVAKVNHSVHHKMAEAQQELSPASILSMEGYKIWEVFLAMKARLHSMKYKAKLEQRLLHLRELTEDRATQLLVWTMLRCLKQPPTGLIGKEMFPNVVEPPQTYHSPNVAARTPLVITDIHASRRRNWLCRQTSTRDDLLAWLRASRGENYGPIGPVSHIYWIIHNDIVDLISLTNAIVDQVITMSSDEEKVERNLPQWRNLISRLEAEYRRFEFQFRLLPRFFASGYSNHIGEALYKQESETSREQQDLVDEIQVIRNRLTFALQALVSAVSVIESRRGIAEAESVTKLTELGEFLGEMTYDCRLI